MRARLNPKLERLRVATSHQGTMLKASHETRDRPQTRALPNKAMQLTVHAASLHSAACPTADC